VLQGCWLLLPLLVHPLRLKRGRVSHLLSGLCGQLRLLLLLPVRLPLQLRMLILVVLGWVLWWWLLLLLLPMLRLVVLLLWLLLLWLLLLLLVPLRLPCLCPLLLHLP
jgi:hypothetical protein